MIEWRLLHFHNRFSVAETMIKFWDGKDGFVKLDFSKKVGVSQSRNDRLKSMDVDFVMRLATQGMIVT
jgi:hypothetical protein